LARRFKFHTLDDLERESHRLGLSLRLDRDLSPLFRTVLVGQYRLGNSLCVQPMEGCDSTLDGRPDDLTFRRWRRIGAGGAKLLWGEATAVTDDGRANPRQLLLNEHTAAEFERLLAQCRRAHRDALGSEEDLLVGLQLTHSGRYSYRQPILGRRDEILDPRTPDAATGKTVEANCPLASDDYLKRLTDSYVFAARLAFNAGFQFVDIKQCHGYLLNELLGARTRPGPYGGSLENRTRLARDIICRIQFEVPGLLIATRLNVFDGVPFVRGLKGEIGRACDMPKPLKTVWGGQPDTPLQPDLSEPLAWIGEMAQLGVSLLNVSLGNPYVSPHLLRPFEYPPPDGYQSPEHPLEGVDRHFKLTAVVQEAFPDLPIVGSGYSYLQEFLFHAGAANVRARRVTLVGVGRASLPQPDFARQLVEHGRLDRRRTCRTFSYCTALMRAKENELGQFAAGCPPFDKDVYGPIWREAKRTKET
jgi:2,4-dienoyl-CoA reductase-like NADH-dependent reductase (Old Yellow Enzyme family)